MPVDEWALAESIDTLNGVIESMAGPPVQPISAHLSVIVAAAADLFGVDSVGMLLLNGDGRLQTVASSTALAAALEQAQQTVGVGPGHDTHARRGSVLVADLAAVPEYAPLLAAIEPLTPRAVLSAPIWVDTEVVGNLNLIRSDVHRWTEAEARAAAAYAEVVGRLLSLGARALRFAPTPQQPVANDHADIDGPLEVTDGGK